MFNLLTRVLLVLTVAICLSATTVLASGTPDPGMSTVQDCLVTCPGGGISFGVTVMDNTGTPVPSVVVEMDFCSCPEAQLCLQTGGAPCANGKNDRLLVTTNAAGVALFYPASGDKCEGSLVDIVAGGVLLAQRIVHPMDVDGDFVVEEEDFIMHNVYNDYNCDGVSNLVDITIFNPHFGHTCDAPVSDENQTWGGIKSLWR